MSDHFANRYARPSCKTRLIRMRPIFSVITPSYNQGRFIERTIQSVLMQEMPNLEYVVVDGGSTDQTVGILRRYDGSLRWVSEQDDGQSDAINKGLLMTSGELFGWLNSDDIYYPGALQAAWKYFEAHPGADVLYGDAYHIDERDNPIERYKTEPWCADRLKEVCYLCQPAVFLRRRVVNRLGMLDSRLEYCMDYEYWLRLAIGGARFAYLSQILAGSRLHAKTKTLGQRMKVHREINDMMRQRLGVVPDRWILNYAHSVVEAKGFRRTHPLRFAVAVSVASLDASIRWNRAISRNVLQTTWGWMSGNARAALKQVFAR